MRRAVEASFAGLLGPPRRGRGAIEYERCTMGVSFEWFMGRFTAEERAEIDTHADRFIAEEMSRHDQRELGAKA